MKIEIWSDIMCPFCYIGKRHLEEALAAFPDLAVQIEWKSFQLDPAITPQPGKNVYAYLAERKGLSLAESTSMHKNVSDAAAAVDLHYDFDNAIIANSLRAHQLIQLAKTKGLGDLMEEVFFSAYFCEGEDLNDDNTLMRLGVAAGLNPLDIQETLSENSFSAAINNDIYEAEQIGVRGVPFFVFNRKYAISGAQPIAAFIETIQALV